MEEKNAILIEKNDSKYQKWLRNNLSGFVANIKDSWRKNKSYYYVHKATCSRITPGSSRSNAPGAFTEHDYRKVVGATPESIVAWGINNGFGPTSMQACGGCLKGFKLPSLPPEAGWSERDSDQNGDSMQNSRAFDKSRPPKKGFKKGAGRASPEETLALKEKAVQGHHALLVALSNVLESANWTKVEEIPSAIDLWARSPIGNQRVIFEAKTLTLGNELHQVRAALAQLLEYRYQHGNPKDELCLVVNRQLSEVREKFLKNMRITILWQDRKQFQAAGDTSREWVSTLPQASVAK